MNKFLFKVGGLYVNLVIRAGSLWVGCHYSEYYKSVCIALIPCVVIRVGYTPYGECTSS